MIAEYDSLDKRIEIKLNENERYIKSFSYMNLDITVVEILGKDDIYKDFFLEPESEKTDEELINKEIYIPQYPLGQNLKNSRGRILRIEDDEFNHSASTQNGSSGSPAFLKGRKEVFGIHRQGSKDNSGNYGHLLYPIFDEIKNDIIKRAENLRQKIEPDNKLKNEGQKNEPYNKQKSEIEIINRNSIKGRNFIANK